LKTLEILGRLALALAVLCTPLPLAGQSAQSREAPATSGPNAESSASPGAQRRTEEFGLLPDRPRVTPTRIDKAPRIDGVLDDEAWQIAAHITDFTQQAPLDGAPATEETDVYVAYDSDNLYFGFHVHYEDPSIMRANRVERDRAMRDDLMTIYLDTFLDQQRGYDFDVNGYGVQGDGVMTAGGRGGRGGGQAIPPADRTWDALFQTGAQIVYDGYVAEMAIPFKSLRYPKPEAGEPHRWGFQIVREIKSKDEENQVWSPMSRNETSFFAQMGLIEGMTDLSTSRNLEIMPTVTAIQYGDIDPTRPAFVNHSADPDAGVNVKYGITSNLTADFTVNPDFSQIESDRQQIEVNQRYPIFYSELRPFFVEGSEIFSITAPVTFVHTRTIVDPDYGAKITGQVGRFSIGALTANDRAPGRVDDTSDPAFDQTAQTFIGRVLFDLYSESNLGAIFTDREFLDGHSRTFGMNGNFRFSPTISGDLTAVGSWHLDPGAGDRTQGNMISTRLSGNGRNVGWSLNGYQISPDFETDVGFVRRRDQRNIGSNLRYRFWPQSWIINWGPSLSYARTYDYDGVLEDENLGTRLNFSFARSISFDAGFDHDMERYGGIDFYKNGYSFGGRVNTSRSYELGGNFSWGDEIYYAGLTLGRQVNWSVNGTVRPTSALSVGLNFNSRRLTDPTNGDAQIFDVQILRATTNYQITDRLGVRNITEWNTEDETLDLNMLLNYRVNAGTVFYLGYDDHYRQADLIEGDMNGDGADEQLFFTNGLRRTNRAIFAKLQYLIRY
jgi:hypothetical protein